MKQRDIEAIAEEIKYGAKLAYESRRRAELWRLYYELVNVKSSEKVRMYEKVVRVSLFAVGLFLGMGVVLILDRVFQ